MREQWLRAHQMLLDFSLNFSCDMPLLHHPQNHCCQKKSPNQHCCAFKNFFCPALKAASKDSKNNSRKYACQNSKCNSIIDSLFVVLVVCFIKISKNNPDNQACFQSFP